MSLETTLAFSLFALVTSITPGPNNFMLLASGVNFGFRATLPHILGISLGFLVMVVGVGLGLAEAFVAFPSIYVVLKWVGALYMLYLAWGIATAGPLGEDASSEPGKTRPMSFLGAALFQWVNPKAWIMAIGTFSTYIPATSGLLMIIGAATLFTLIGAPAISLWVVFGSSMRRFLTVRRNQLIFNYSMALLLVLSLYPLLTAV